MSRATRRRKADQAAPPVVRRVEEVDFAGLICTYNGEGGEECRVPAQWKVWAGSDTWCGIAACAEHVPRWRR